VIEVTGVGLRRGGRELFHDFNLTLPDPGLYVVAGGNASGKTLLAQLLTGQLRPQRGRVAIDGSSVYGWLPQLSRPPIWYCSTTDDVRSSETLDNYLRTTVFDLNGNARDLRVLRHLLGQNLSVPLDAELALLSQGQLALAQVGLACVLPARLVILDGHFGLLDEETSAVAAQLLTENQTQPETLVMVLATRFSAALPSALASYRLGSGPPVTLSVPPSAETAAQPTTAATQDRRLLRVTLEGGRQAGAAYQSGASYMVQGLLERGLRIELKGELAQALAEMEHSGLRVKGIEWE
jgi:ABC-type Mn2+/Zn2+ transport system ATPase subunit